MFDVLGREFKDYNSIPNGTLYIQNKIKQIKTSTNKYIQNILQVIDTFSIYL